MQIDDSARQAELERQRKAEEAAHQAALERARQAAAEAARQAAAKAAAQAARRARERDQYEAMRRTASMNEAANRIPAVFAGEPAQLPDLDSPFAGSLEMAREAAAAEEATATTAAHPLDDGTDWPVGPLEPSQEPSDDAHVMQERLTDLGYLDEADYAGNEGVYGPKTIEAVREFQLANGIHPVDGMASVETLAAMGAATALTTEEALANVGDTIIGDPVGTAGPPPQPTVDTLEVGPPPTGVIQSASGANVRSGPSTDQERVGQFASGTLVTITEPQPDGGTEGWVHVSGESTDGKPISGWVADGDQGIDLVSQNETPGDPRVEARMEELGYIPPGAPAGEEAITNFQLMNGMEPTGKLDDETLAAMWSPDAILSNHIRQVADDTYNHSADAPGQSNNCGPTSVAMATAAVGLTEIDNDDPQQAIDDARDATGGTNGSRTGSGDLINAVEAAGGEGYRVRSLDEAKIAIANGDPVVLFGNPYGGHWVVAQGYDPATDTWLVSDPLSTTGVARWTNEQMQIYYNSSQDGVGVHNPADG